MPIQRYEKTEFGEIPEGWHLVKLNDIIHDKNSIKIGPFGSSLKKHELQATGEIKTLWIENIVNNKFDWSYQRYISKEKYDELKSFTVKPNDILVTMMGTIGKIAIVPKDIGTAIITSHLLKITLDLKKSLPIFMHYYLTSHLEPIPKLPFCK